MQKFYSLCKFLYLTFRNRYLEKTKLFIIAELFENWCKLWDKFTNFHWDYQKVPPILSIHKPRGAFTVYEA